MYLLTGKKQVVLQLSTMLLKQTSMEIHGKDIKKSHISKNKTKKHNLFTLFSLSTYFDQTILSTSLQKSKKFDKEHRIEKA